MRLSLFTHTLKCIRENGQLRFGKFKIFVDSIINFNARKTFFELQTFIELNPKKLCLKNPLFCLSSFLDKMLTSRIVCSVINTLEAKQFGSKQEEKRENRDADFEEECLFETRTKILRYQFVPITDISEVEINATIGVHILSSVCPNAKLQSNPVGK